MGAQLKKQSGIASRIILPGVDTAFKTAAAALPRMGPPTNLPAMPDKPSNPAGGNDAAAVAQKAREDFIGVIDKIMNPPKAQAPAVQPALPPAPVQSREASNGDAKKPLWSKPEEAKWRDIQRYGETPKGKIYAQNANEAADSPVPPELEGQYRTADGNRDPKTGLTNEADWRDMTKPQSPNRTDPDWVNTGRGRMDARTGMYEERGLGADGKPNLDADARWVQMPKPADVLLSEHFGEQWGKANPAERTAMLRNDITGSGPISGWVKPSDTAEAVGAGAAGGNDRTITGQSIPQGSRTVSADGKIVGFATTGLPQAQPPPVAQPALPAIAGGRPDEPHEDLLKKILPTPAGG